MRLPSSILAIVFALTSTVAMAGDPVGHYKVDGKNPSGDGSYSGQVTVTKTGDTFKVVWIIAGATYIGTGLGNDEFMAVSYKSGDATGLALYSPDSSDWKGVWAYAGGTTRGIEKWTRQ